MRNALVNVALLASLKWPPDISIRKKDPVVNQPTVWGTHLMVSVRPSSNQLSFACGRNGHV